MSDKIDPHPWDYISAIQPTSGHRERISKLEDIREQAILQVVLLSGAVVHDAESIMHHEASHYLVNKETMDALKKTLKAYNAANEDYIAAYSGIEVSPSTKEM